MKYSNIKYNCASNGEGVRTAVYLSGCRLHCKGCFNPELWDFDHGQDLTNDVITKIMDSIAPGHISGLSILGGEPLDGPNIESVKRLVAAFRQRFGNTKTIWLWTGHIVDSFKDNQEIISLLSAIDVVVDGPFIESQADVTLKFRGSANQRILTKENREQLLVK